MHALDALESPRTAGTNLNSASKGSDDFLKHEIQRRALSYTHNGQDRRVLLLAYFTKDYATLTERLLCSLGHDSDLINHTIAIADSEDTCSAVDETLRDACVGLDAEGPTAIMF